MMVNFLLITLLVIVFVYGQVIYDAHQQSHHRRVANCNVERKSTENLVKNTPEWKANNPPKPAPPQMSTPRRTNLSQRRAQQKLQQKKYRRAKHL
jgi:ABC-type transport system involved in cytochrome bd biosynthesis fused ATPase/permease subunit